MGYFLASLSDPDSNRKEAVISVDLRVAERKGLVNPKAEGQVLPRALRGNDEAHQPGLPCFRLSAVNHGVPRLCNARNPCWGGLSGKQRQTTTCAGPAFFLWRNWVRVFTPNLC